MLKWPDSSNYDTKLVGLFQPGVVFPDPPCVRRFLRKGGPNDGDDGDDAGAL